MIWQVSHNNKIQEMPEEVLVYKIQNEEISPDALVINQNFEKWIQLNHTQIWKDNALENNDVEYSEGLNSVTENAVIMSTADNKPDNTVAVDTEEQKKKKIKKWIFACVACIVVAIILINIFSGDKPFAIKDVELENKGFPYEEFKGYWLLGERLEPLFSSCGFDTSDSQFLQYGLNYRRGTNERLVEYITEGYVKIPKSRYGISYKYTLLVSVYGGEYNYDEDEGYQRCSLELYFFESNDTSNFYQNNTSWTHQRKIFSYEADLEGSNSDTASCTDADVYKALKKFFDRSEIKEKLVLEKQSQ